MSKAITIAGVKPTILTKASKNGYDLMFFPVDICCHYCNSRYLSKYEQYYRHTFQEWMDSSIMIKTIAPNKYVLVCLNCQDRWEIDQVCPDI